MAVAGLEGFAKYFKGFEDCYTIIGGAACEILMSEVPVPALMEIRASNTGGEIFDYERRRARIFFAEPKHRRFIRVVDWMDTDGAVRFSDHYDRFGRRFAQTVLDAAGRPVLRTYYDRKGKEVILEHLQAKKIVLTYKGKEYFFPDRTAFVLHYLNETGIGDKRILFNSLSTPFFVSERMEMTDKDSGADILFWQEQGRDGIPGNMRMILEDKAKRADRVLVQSRFEYDRLIAAGADKSRMKALGFVYEMNKENSGAPHALILTNSDRVEHLTYLATELPELTFHVAALTEMSSRLSDTASLPNIRLYPCIRQEKADELFSTCDYYLDINHHGEIMQAVQTAFFNQLLIAGFTETIHQPDYIAPEHRFDTTDAEHMVSFLRRALKERAFREKALSKQMKYAMVETVADYQTAIS